MRDSSGMTRRTGHESADCDLTLRQRWSILLKIIELTHQMSFPLIYSHVSQCYASEMRLSYLYPYTQYKLSFYMFRLRDEKS